MSGLSTNIGRPVQAVEATIRDSMGDVAELVGADRICAFAYDFEKQSASATQEWARAGVASVIAEYQDVPLISAPDWDLAAHLRGEMIWWPDVPSQPTGPARDRLLRDGLKSLMAIPVMDADHCIGFVSYAWLRQHDSLQGVERHVLAVLSRLIASTMRREQSEAASEARYRQLFDAIPDGVILIGADGRIVRANIAHARMYRYDSPEDLIGVYPPQFVAPSSRQYSEQVMRRRLGGEGIGGTSPAEIKPRPSLDAFQSRPASKTRPAGQRHGRCETSSEYPLCPRDVRPNSFFRTTHNSWP